MKDKERILKELLKIVDGDAVTPEVVTKLFKFSRIQSSLNEKLLAKEVSKVIARDTLSRVLNPFYLKEEEAEKLAQGEILIGTTPEEYVVGYDFDEIITIVAGTTGSGKSTLLARILVQLQGEEKDEEKSPRLLE